MPVYEMFWDCEACGTTKLLGKSHRHCPACGAPQDPERRYFPQESEKVAVQDHVFVGVDRTCSACDTANAAGAAFCVNCGNPMDGAESVDKVSRVKQGHQAGSLHEKTPEPAPESASEPATARRRLTWRSGMLVLAVVAAVLTPLLLWSRPVDVSVTGHHWERAVHIEVFAAVSDGSWCDAMPSDAYRVSSSTRQRGTTSVPDGEECSTECTTYNVDNGDGTFSQDESCSEVCTTVYREEPVYDEWCDYTVDRWRHDHTERSSGDGLSPSPHWPSYTVSDCTSLGCTRVGSTDEDYMVALVDDEDDPHECDVAQERWGAMGMGEVFSARKRVLTGWLVCAQLE